MITADRAGHHYEIHPQLKQSDLRMDWKGWLAIAAAMAALASPLFIYAVASL